MEFWTATVAAPTRSADFARQAQARGWDGMLVVDSQNLSGDPYVCLGAYVNVVCHDDPAVGRELGRATTGLFARFSVMYGEISGPADERQAEVFHQLHDRYDMNAHGQSGGQQTTALTEEFIDGYAVVGGPEHCAARLGDLVELGIDKFAVMGPNFAAANPEAQAAAVRFAEDVLPALRGP